MGAVGFDFEGPESVLMEMQAQPAQNQADLESYVLKAPEETLGQRSVYPHGLPKPVFLWKRHKDVQDSRSKVLDQGEVRGGKS